MEAFTAGQEILWKPESETTETKLLSRLRRQYGDGPFTIVEVQGLSPEHEEYASSPHVLVLKDLDGNILPDNSGGVGVFNTSFFTRPSTS